MALPLSTMAINSLLTGIKYNPGFVQTTLAHVLAPVRYCVGLSYRSLIKRTIGEYYQLWMFGSVRFLTGKEDGSTPVI